MSAPLDPAQWVGRLETRWDVASHARVAALRALLDDPALPWPDAVLPPLAHWLHFWPVDPQSRIGSDGHPERDAASLVPPLEGLPRRMWAGGEIEFVDDIRIGRKLQRVSTVHEVTPRAGRSGPLVFVALSHAIRCNGRIAIRERQDLVFRGAAATPAAPSPPLVPGVVRKPGTFTTDPVALFRYSALTFNSHRIHYDRDYARDVEGYPDLVVQGPLLATLLMAEGTKRAPRRRLQRFTFRGEAPAFSGEALEFVEEAGKLKLRKEDGSVVMSATLEFAP